MLNRLHHTRGALIATAAALTFSCDDEIATAGRADDYAVSRDLKRLASHRVLFAHHSVGRDILAGVARLTRSGALGSLAVDSVAVGKNGDPLGKIADFERAAIESRDDVVVMKLCFADFTPSTDARALVAAYRSAVAHIRAARPGVVVVHTTPALHARQVDARSWLKRVVGRSVWEDEANARRAEYADGVRDAFRGEPLFDVSLIESTASDGTPADAIVDGRRVPMLWRGYTDDGGHLNERGRRVAARIFLDTLASAVSADDLEKKESAWTEQRPRP